MSARAWPPYLAGCLIGALQPILIWSVGDTLGEHYYNIWPLLLLYIHDIHVFLCSSSLSLSLSLHIPPHSLLYTWSFSVFPSSSLSTSSLYLFQSAIPYSFTYLCVFSLSSIFSFPISPVFSKFNSFFLCSLGNSSSYCTILSQALITNRLRKAFPYLSQFRSGLGNWWQVNSTMYSVTPWYH